MERKYIIRNILLTVASLLTIASCKRDSFLDTTNKSNLDDGTMWISEKNADIFLNGCYAELYPTDADWPDTQLDNFSDDAHARVYFGSYAWKEGTIDISLRPTTSWKAQGPSNGNNSWQKTYQNVRNLNSFIENVRSNAQNFSTEYILKRIDEARFLRAYFYSELFMRVGGVVIDTVVQRRSSSSTEELQRPRNTFEETYNFIISELDEIVNNGYLKIKYENSDADAGRATLGSALVLKGWLQLFAASPAYNSSSPAIASDPGNLQHFSAEDPGRWAAAAATNKKFIETWGHKGEGIYQLFPDMVNFWREENEYNPEVIWDRQFVPVTMPNLYGAYGGPCNIDGIINVDWGEYQPTQSIIDDYQMDNGKDITDPASGYNPQNPYAGREKRFYDFICYDGASYYREWMSKTDTVWMRIDKVNPRNNEIDLSGANDATQTGYWFTKQLSKYDPRNLVDCGQNYVFYRYAEVLLNYAEAQNEAVGPDASVHEAINAIRTRPGTDLPVLPAGLSKDEMRKAIHRERRIELAYEQKRLFDIWRWKEADARLNQPTMGMKVYNSKPNDNSGVWIYEKFPLAMGHLFTNKMYFSPIPQEVIDRNPKIVQNSGY